MKKHHSATPQQSLRQKKPHVVIYTHKFKPEHYRKC